MSAFETFTAEEITSIFEEICSEVQFIKAEETDEEVAGSRLFCDVGGIEFSCFFLGEDPFFNGLSLLSARSAPPNPLHFCNSFNTGPGVSRAFRLNPFDDEDDIGVDENGRMLLYARLFIYFDGGITKEHIEFLIYMWIEDLYTFNEIDDDDDEDVIDVDIPDSLSGVGIPLIERIAAFLEIRATATAREIAKAMRVDKQKVNGVLYRNLQTFSKSTDQPPHWSVKK